MLVSLDKELKRYLENSSIAVPNLGIFCTFTSKKVMAPKKKHLKKKGKDNPKAKKVKKAQKKGLNAPKWGLIGTLLFTFMVFFNTTSNEFVNWDDDKNFYENTMITQIHEDNFWSQTKKIFTNGVIGNYNPLTIWTFAIEKKIWGLDDPSKWHLDNILLHLIGVFFVFKLCLLLGLRWQGATLVALLFGIHPMRVESVAWVTERKDVLFGAFYFAALYLYTKKKKYHRGSDILIGVLFILALLSKIQAVTLPLSMIAVDYWMDGRLDVRSMVKKWPYFLLSLIFGLLGIFFLRNYGSLESNEVYPIWQRLFVGTYSYLVYLVKSVVPFRMSPLYPYPAKVPWYFYASFIILPILIWGAWTLYRRKNKVWFFGGMFFTVNIIFMLQILGAGQGFLADRFTYVAYFGLFFIPGYYFDAYMSRKGQTKKIALVLALLAVIVYSSMTFRQNQVWKNSGTLWTHVLKYYKNTVLPYGNRANYYRDEGKIVEALKDYSEAIRLKPSNAPAFNSRGKLYFNATGTGNENLKKALSDYSKAIEYDPKNGEYYVNRGATYARLGDIDRAIADIDKGLELKPDHITGYLNRSIMYNVKKDYAAALKDIETYLRYNPNNPDMWHQKGLALRQVNRVSQAIGAFDMAIRINPNNGVYYYERGRTHMYLKNKEKARMDISRAMALGFKNIDPNLKAELGI